MVLRSSQPSVAAQNRSEFTCEPRGRFGTSKVSDTLEVSVASTERRAGIGTTYAVVLSLLVTGCASTQASSHRPGVGTWREIPASPLTARIGAVTAWTGKEALFLGGAIGAPCPPNADCAGPDETADGAAFDPAQGTWRRTATAPATVRAYSSRVVIGDEVFLWGPHRLMSYNASSDAWTVHPASRPDLVGADLATIDARVVGVRGERPPGAAPDQIYDPATRTWLLLPQDLLGASFDRSVTATPLGLVLTGKTLVPQPGSDGPAVVRAEVLNMATMVWRQLPDSDQLGGSGWAWTGTRMIDPSLGGEDGGEVNGYGRTVPHGGTLDPAAGKWGRLTDPPAQFTGGWPAFALGGSLSATQGWIYDDSGPTWSKLSRPAAAPPAAGDAVWAGRRLIVVGGTDTSKGYTSAALSKRAWMLTVPG
ncbi:MAG: hypothetical protein QOG22_1259 [Pseudonocardiales bacterium]|nr:hypothetical protein [Pseudonocardiales bacterium]